jgi:siroheme synthase
VLFATRHLAAGAINGLAAIGPDVTLVLYMPGRDYAAIAAELVANGWPPATQCAAVSSLGSAAQQMAMCALSYLPRLTPFPSPVLMLFFPPEKAGRDSGL